MYSASPAILKGEVKVPGSEPALFVFKDNQYYQFDQEDFKVEREERSVDEDEAVPTPPTTVANTSIYSWMMKERFPMFAKVTRGRFGKIMATNKFVVMAVVDENKLEQISPEMELFKEMVRQVVVNNQEKYLKHFQFGWTGSPDLANSVAMETLSLPNLIVINSTTYQHHLPEDAIKIFLDSILAGEAPSYGGSGMLVRLYRSFY